MWTLPDMPSETFIDTDNDNVHVLYSESESGSGNEKDSDDNSWAVGATVWTKYNFPPRLEIFQG
jgi:hypothetical protein